MEKVITEREDINTANNSICCGILEKMDISWCRLEDGTLVMPYIEGNDGLMYRVNNCPSCGAYVRSAQIIK